MIAALVDPNAKTLTALNALLETSFVHYIDAPVSYTHLVTMFSLYFQKQSLALIVPILERGLRERVTDIKKRAAQIMGQMASLTDRKDLIPYLQTLMSGLKEVLVDPNPEARAIVSLMKYSHFFKKRNKPDVVFSCEKAANALGSMYEKLGESNFPGLVSELLATLKSETSAVDRSGAAQGLSEVLAGSSLDKMEALLPDMIANAMSARTYVREGFLTLFVFLPATIGDRFQPHIASIIPPILRGLADEVETVRDTSMKAGRGIIKNYSMSAVSLLLPELELGLFDDNWRIRMSSVQLMGE